MRGYAGEAAVKSLLVIVEGADGVGKTGQTLLLAAKMRNEGYLAEAHGEPTGGAVGRVIRDALAGDLTLPPTALRLLFAADRQEHSRYIAAILASGASVVCDRYDLSNLTRAWAEEPTLESLDWTKSLDRGIVIPDLTIVLQAPLDVCLARIAARGRADIYETAEMQEKVHAAYAMAHSLLGRPVSYVDANGTPDEVAERVWAVVKNCIAERSEG